MEHETISKRYDSLYDLLTDNVGEGNLQEFIIPIGVEDSGNIVYQDISQISHILVSGTTGSGKTSFIQSVISSIMFTAPTNMAKLLIYDSKGIDYMVFKEAPELLIPIINDHKKVLGALNWLVGESNKRIDTQTKNLDEFNDMPHIFVILDDYSQIITDESRSYLESLLKVGRISKIHCILSTSTPVSNIVSTEIKANVPCRIAFHTTQKSVSRMIIDENGAELLQIPGEMIFKGQNISLKCKSLFIEDREVKLIIDGTKKLMGISLEEKEKRVEDLATNIERMSSCESLTPDEIDNEADELLPKAIEIAISIGQISTAMIQRKLKLGYSRAGRIIDQMEARGIISGADGSKPRNVCLDRANEFLNNSLVQGNIPADNKGYDIERTNIEVVNLRPFPKIESYGESVEIQDNLIIVKKITGRQGAYVRTVQYTFNSQRLIGLVYSKPKLIAKGSLKFIISPNNWNINDSINGKQFHSDLPQTELELFVSKSNSAQFEMLVRQLATDCAIKVIFK